MSPLIEATRIGRRFGAGRHAVQAVTDVTLRIGRGEVLGLVGESGSGKSTIGRMILGLLPASSGEIRFDGAALPKVPGPALRRRMQLVFQDPYSSLDPRRRVGAQIGDGLAIHDLRPKRARPGRVAELLAQVGLEPAHATRFPHEFSGGQRQRIGIARALAPEPDLLVADEPVSALDVSVQAQVLALLSDLRARLGLSILFISHDLGVVRHLCDRVVVLYLGRIMEEGPAAQLFDAPRHPYTRALLSASPRLDRAARRQRIILQGDPPSPSDPPSGCVFRTRCPHAAPVCAEAPPPLRSVAPGQFVACVRDEAVHDGTTHDGTTHDGHAHDRTTHDGTTHDRTGRDGTTHDGHAHDRTTHDRTTHDRTTHDRTTHDGNAPDGTRARWHRGGAGEPC